MSENQSAPAPIVVAAARPQPMARVEKGIALLRKIGVNVDAQTNALPVSGLLEQIRVYGEPQVVAIAATLGRAQLFNEVVRDQLQGVSVGDRYLKISDNFTSVREDAKRMLENMNDGKYDLRERMSDTWMNLTRGPIPKRFNKISEIAKDVFTDTEQNLTRLRTIFDAYSEFRLGMKEAGMLAHEVFDKAEADYKAKEEGLRLAQAAIPAEDSTDVNARNQAEMNRDIALRNFQDADRRTQIARDVRDNLQVSYYTGEAIMTRLAQTAHAQERVWSQSVTFFATNENVLTSLSASFTMLKGLHESTQTHEMLKKGMKEALDDLATTGTAIQERAIRAGYGPTIPVESVQNLVNAIVDYQGRMVQIVAEERVAAEENARAIAVTVEDGRKKLVELMVNPAPSAPVRSLPSP